MSLFQIFAARSCTKCASTSPASPASLNPRDHPFAIRERTILTHLPFAFDAANRDFDADDRPHLHADEIGRRIVDLPRLRPARFSTQRKIFNLLGAAPSLP